MKLMFSVLLAAIVSVASAQQQIDGIAGVVGGHVVLESDIYIQMEQMKLQGYPIVEGSRCELFENYMFQKLLLQQIFLRNIQFYFFLRCT